MSRDGIQETHSDRPTSPDALILDIAARKIETVLESPGAAHAQWEVGPRIDRPRSSVFPIRLFLPSSDHVQVFYKVFAPPEGDPGRGSIWAQGVAAELSRTTDLDEKLAALIGDEPIAISRALAVDPESLTLVTLGVGGEPLGKVWRHTLTPVRRWRILDAMELAGRAAWLIEHCSPPSVDPDLDAVQRSLARHDARMTRVLADSRLARVVDRMSELRAITYDDPKAFVYAHADLSSSNILIREQGIGLIDFSWSPRLRGFDVARLAFRLEYDTVSSQKWAQAMVASLLAGYGDPDPRALPNWTTLRIPWLLKIVDHDSRAGSRRYRTRANRALAEIESLV